MSTFTVEADDRGSHSASISSHALFVSPHVRREGFWASIRRHVLDLAAPNNGHALAPTPNDLFIVSTADIDLTVTVSGHAKRASAALAAAFDNSLAARSLPEPVAHLSWEGANR